MTEDDLKSLKDLPVPQPRAEARSAAIAAALAEFDNPKENPQSAQGNAPAARPIHASPEHKRRLSMRAIPFNYKVAASIAVLALAAPLTMHLMKQQNMDQFAGLRQSAENPQWPSVPHGSPAPKVDAPASPALGIPSKDRRQEAERVQDGLAGGAPARSEPAGNNSLLSSPLAESGRMRAAHEDSNPPTKPKSLVQPEFEAPADDHKADADGLGRIAEAQPLPATPISPEVDNIARQDTKEFRDEFQTVEINPVKQVSDEPVSTFSIDVDTAAYAFIRRALNSGQLPAKAAVRVEEMINYFPYDYPRPETAETPFQPSVTVTPSPWNPANKLIHIGIKGYDVTPAERPRANLVFLIDVSGSMASEDKLALLKNSFRMLVETLQPDDTVGIVTYASGSGILLEPTKISDSVKILAAIEALGAGGSTAGAEGIQDAYRLAEANFDKEGVNRIILATDGDFNVGQTDDEALKGLIERKRESGIFLSILGVGQGNYNDALMQTLAQNGNGTAAYVDTLSEARKVLVDEASSTLFTIAKDVKIQIEFNPQQISEYRLIGYETRALKREDFNNDKVDAGDIGSGHTVTAIYEVTPVGAPGQIDELRYGGASAEKAPSEAATETAQTNELAFLKLRYKLPEENSSKLITVPIGGDMERSSIDAAPEDVRFSVAVAAFGQILGEGGRHMRDYTYDDVISLAQNARGADPFGYRAEFLNLVRLAKSARP